MLTVILYRGGYEWSGGTSGTGFNATAVLNNGTAAPDTDAASPNGMPWDENARLNDYVANIGVAQRRDFVDPGSYGASGPRPQPRGHRDCNSDGRRSFGWRRR